jgi:hypothetical protein
VAFVGLVVVVVEVLVVVVEVLVVVVEVVDVVVGLVVVVGFVLVVVVGVGAAMVDGVGSTGTVRDEAATARPARGRTWRWFRLATVRRAGLLVAVEVVGLRTPAGALAGPGATTEARATRLSAVATTKPSVTQATRSRRRNELVGSQAGAGFAGGLSRHRVRAPRRV